jgi:hypothetical protein
LFHFGSFPLEGAFSFADNFASNAIPLFRPRDGSQVARAQAVDDGADDKKESRDEAEESSEGEDDDDEDSYAVPGTTKGSSGDTGDPASDAKRSTAEEDDDSWKKNERTENDAAADVDADAAADVDADAAADAAADAKRTSASFLRSRRELAQSVIRFAETAEILCLLTAGGARVARLARRAGARELLSSRSSGKKHASVDFVVGAVAASPTSPPPPSFLSIGRIGSLADGALFAAVGVHAIARRVAGKNNVAPVPFGRAPSVPGIGFEAQNNAQFDDVISRVRARAALLSDVRKDLASSRLQAEIAAKAAANAAANAAKATTASGSPSTTTDAIPVPVGATGEIDGPGLVAARLEAKLAREAAEATTRHREIEVSAANARAAAAEEMANAARARAAEAEALLARRNEMDRRDEWQTETEVRTINTTRSTRGGAGFGGFSAPSYDQNAGAGQRSSQNASPYQNAGAAGFSSGQRDARSLGPPVDRPTNVSDLVSAQVDAETLALREEVARLKKQAAEEMEDCGFEDGYEGPFDECQ